MSSVPGDDEVFRTDGLGLFSLGWLGGRYDDCAHGRRDESNFGFEGDTRHGADLPSRTGQATEINDEYLKAPLNAARGNDGLAFTVSAVDIVNGSPSTDINRRLQTITGGGFPAAPYVPPPFTFARP